MEVCLLLQWSDILKAQGVTGPGSYNHSFLPITYFINIEKVEYNTSSGQTQARVEIYYLRM